MGAVHYHDEDIASSIRRRLDRPIALIGMMGVGKTHLGHMLAKVLDLDFVDSDQEIEKAAGMEISDIFDRFGEAYFREGECRVLERILQEGCRIIATGGGAIMNEETARILWDKTLTVWLKADIDIMVERTGRSDKRPLLRHADPGKVLSELAERRYPVYARADITIKSDKGPAQAVLNRMLAGIDSYLRSEK